MFKWLIPSFGYGHRCKTVARRVFAGMHGGAYARHSLGDICKALYVQDTRWANNLHDKLYAYWRNNDVIFNERDFAKWIYDNKIPLPRKL